MLARVVPGIDWLARVGIAIGAMALVIACGAPLAMAAFGDPPVVDDLEVSDITVSSATFGGTVNPNEDQTLYRFEFKEPSEPDWQEAGSGFVEGSGLVSVGVEDYPFLSPATEYVARLSASNPAGSVISEETTFETLPELPPTVAAVDVSEITNDTADFAVDVDSNGSESTARFEYRRVGDPEWTRLPAEEVSVGNSGDPVSFSRSVSDLDAATDYVVRAIVANAVGDAMSGETSFTSDEPVAPFAEMAKITNPFGAEAGVTGLIDPRGESGGTYLFQYRPAGTDTWLQAPASEVPFQGSEVRLVAQMLAGLDTHVEYEVRLVASGAGGSGISDITTFVAEPRASSLSRGFEQVTPTEKHGVDLVPGSGGIPNGTVASGSGNGFVFTPNADLGEASASETPYLSVRTQSGWTSKPLNVGSRPARFTQFTDTLSKVVVVTDGSPEAAPPDNPGVHDLFVRDNDADTYALLTTDAASSSTVDAPTFAWASADLGNVLLGTDNQTYVPGAPPTSVYRLSQGRVSVASIQPGSEEPFPVAGAGAGLNLSEGGLSRAMSEDGSRIYFTAPASLGQAIPIFFAQLYLRRGDGTSSAETIQVSAPEAGVEDPLGTWAAFYRGASADGSKVFFTSCQKLTADATADASGGDKDTGRCDPADQTSAFATMSDLYMYDDIQSDLVDLTTADSTGADVQGVVGISDDGTRVYFVARGDLGAGAIAGRNNLYLWQEGRGIVHIAVLADDDADVWADANKAVRESRVTPDGRHLLFASRARLNLHDNAGTKQVYLFDAGEPDRLDCASCPATGPSQRDATISNQVQDYPMRDNLLYSAVSAKRNLSDDGGTVFFEAADPLVPQDTNGRIDVYEFDAAVGRPLLVSTGRSESRSIFAGASRDGANAFFWTREALSGWDNDALNDIYDARVGGGFPEPDKPRTCVDSDCQGDPAAPLTLSSPASGAIEGVGDASPGPRPSFRVIPLSKAERRKLARAGEATLRVRTSRAGMVRLTARARLSRHMSMVGQERTRARKAGVVALTIRLSGAARRVLGDRGTLVLRLSVGFQGVSEREQLRVPLRRASVSADRKGR